MNNIFLKITMFFLGVILSCSLVYADTIHLKSGKEIEGKIVEKTDKYVKIDFYGVKLTFFLDEIERISEDLIVSPSEPPSHISGQSVESISKIISKLRKLDFKSPVNYNTTSKAEIKKLCIKALDKKQKRLHGEEKLLKKLGLLPAYVDYHGLIVDMITQEIGGYYDPDEKKLFIVDEMPKEVWDSIIVHEICHTLQDQHFDLNSFLEKDKKETNSDRQIAHQSVVEGEAFAIMLNYQLRDKQMEFTALPNPTAYMDVIKQEMKLAYPGISSTPTFLGEAMAFPYLQGLNFLKEFKMRYSWEEVSNLYKDTPHSSEQIMHPEKYLQKRDEPISVTLPDLSSILGNKWQEVHQDSLGEFVNKALLSQFSDVVTASLASEGWGGDKVILFENPLESKTILIYLSTWDSREDAEEFFWTYQDVVKNKYLEEKLMGLAEVKTKLWDTEQDKVLLEIRGNDVLVIEGVSAEFKDKIRNEIWDYVKTKRPFTDKEIFLKPDGLKAEDFYQKGKALSDKYKGNTILLYEAMGYLKKVIELNKDFIQAYVRIAGIMVDLGYLKGDEYDQDAVKEAFTWIDKAKEINPDFPDLHRVMAKIYFALKRYDSAEEEIKKAIELDANNSDFYYLAGRIYRAKNEYDKAIEAYNKAAILDPNSSGNYDNLGLIYLDLKDYTKSIQMFEKALELEPNSAWSWNNYSLPLIELGRYDEAIEALKNALKITDFGVAHSNLGRAYMGKGMYEEAEKEFRLINDTEMLAFLYQKIGQPEKQMQMLEENLQWDPQNAWAYVEKARVFRGQGRLDEALSYYNKALEINPNYALVYHDMGQIYETKGDTNKAIEFYNKAIESNPVMSVAYYDLGRVYNVKKQDYNGAIPFLKKSLELNPNYADTYYQLAKSYDSIGNRKDTILNLEKYLELAPNGNEANSVRGYLRKIKNQ